MFTTNSAQAREFVLATLEWPPYACESCPGGGALIENIKRILEGQGHTLRVIFYPWSRCMQEAKKGRVDGCGPTWEADLEGTGLVSSDIIFHSPLGIAERSNDPLKIADLQDLKSIRLGVVQDYGYSTQYLRLVKEGILKPDVVRTDIQNIEKLNAKRIDATLIDTVNFKYLIEVKLSQLKNRVRLNKFLVGMNSLSIGMSEGSAKEFNLILREGIKKEKNLQKSIEADAERIIKKSVKK